MVSFRLFMRRKTRVILLSFILFSLVVLLVLAYVNYRLRSSIKVGFSSERGVELRIDNVHYSGTRDGRRAWDLEAERATRYEKEDRTILDRVRMVFFSGDDSSYVLIADRGEYMEGDGLVKVSGNVTVTSEEGYSLRTETLTYSTALKEIKTDDPVEIDSPFMNVKGVGLVIDVEEGRFSVLKDVRTVLRDALI